MRPKEAVGKVLHGQPGDLRMGGMIVLSKPAGTFWGSRKSLVGVLQAINRCEGSMAKLMDVSNRREAGPGTEPAKDLRPSPPAAGDAARTPNPGARGGPDPGRPR